MNKYGQLAVSFIRQRVDFLLLDLPAQSMMALHKIRMAKEGLAVNATFVVADLQKEIERSKKGEG